MSEPRTVTVIVEWHAVTEPRLCLCGHEHYGRKPDRSNMAPQWRYCEDPDCTCFGLREATP